MCAGTWGDKRPMRIGIVGAGMAGLACAEALRAGGMAVTLFDKGRAPGGRMSTRRVMTPVGEASFDHGAQYFTVRDPAFRERVARWHDAGLAAPWPAAGGDAWVGTPGMNALVRAMAGHADVHWSVQVGALAHEGGQWLIEGGRFDAAVIAVPAEQAAPLLQPWDAALADRAIHAPSAPCWTVLAAFAERLPIAADVMREDGIIGWAARNSAKPGRTGPESWVIQAGPAWSREHLEESPDMIGPALLGAFAQRAGAVLPVPVSLSAHRWRYARSGADGGGAAWNPALRLGACGDWLIGPRVEAAWMSGTALAGKVLGSG